MSFVRFTAPPLLTISLLLMLACSSVQEATNAGARARPGADEAATIMALKTIATAQQNYSLRTGAAYGTFDQLVDSGALDERFRGTAPVVGGYVFTMNVTQQSAGRAAGYTVNADPQATATSPVTGARHYFMDAGGVIHYDDSRAATASDPTPK